MKKVDKTITIDYVAKMAGVSKTTVSRYINGHYEYMSSKTKANIKRIIEEVNYRPNKLAVGLKSQKSHMIGILVADIKNPFSSLLISGIDKICKKHKYNIIIANADDDPNRERESILSMLDQRVEGLIVNTTGENDELLSECEKKGMPIVLADRSSKNFIFDTIVVNNYDTTVKMIDHLVDNGFKNIGFFSENVKNISPRWERLNAFVDTYSKYLKNKNSINDKVFFIHVDKENMIKQSIERLLSTKTSDERTAIFAANGVVLLSVLQGIRKINLRIPEDIGVCGYDDWGWASLIPPGITTVSQPSQLMGMKAAQLLLARIKEEQHIKPRWVVLNANIVVRGSTDVKSSYVDSLDGEFNGKS